MPPESFQFPYGIFLDHYELSRPIDWVSYFGNQHPLVCEIGFGLGEYLIEQSRRSRDTNFIGLELDWARIYKCLQKITTLRMQPDSAHLGDNVRLLKLEAMVAMRWFFRPESLDGIVSLFPCPWPKKSHVKYRLFNREFFQVMNSRLKPDGTIHIVTDWEPYYRWMLDQVGGVEDAGFRTETMTIEAKFGTKFEKKWRAAGQNQFWELRLKKVQPFQVPQEEKSEVKVYFVKDFDPKQFQFENLIGDVSVIYKDFYFDQQAAKGLVRMIVAEKFLTQHVWVAIVKSENCWLIAKAEGHSALPTSGVALAMERVYEAALKTVPQ